MAFFSFQNGQCSTFSRLIPIMLLGVNVHGTSDKLQEYMWKRTQRNILYLMSFYYKAPKVSRSTALSSLNEHKYIGPTPKSITGIKSEKVEHRPKMYLATLVPNPFTN